MDVPDAPANVIWDLTYACPLRCTHCYSESGRRASRKLRSDDLFQVADAIISLRPTAVALAGGEPLVVPEVFDVAERFTAAGIGVVLYTGGWTVDPPSAERIAQTFHQVVVSVDGATAEVHDRIRGRVGSFDRVITALELLDGAAAGLGVEWVVTRSNFDQMESFCSTVVPRFANLMFVSFAAAVPSGLASRPGFTEHELLTDAQVRELGEGSLARRLQQAAPASVKVATSDNAVLQMHPDLIAKGMVFPVMQVEPDGQVRAMPIYEGTVGSLLTEPADVLWRRAVARWSDPFVTATLSGVRSMSDWAEAARRLDYRFGSDEVRARIDRRPAFLPLAPSPA